jgi:hypothetical protein
MRKMCFEIVRNLSGKADYENRSKKRTQDFSRNRKTPFKKLMRLTLSLAKESSQNALERLAVDERSLAKTHIEAPGGVGPGFGGRKPVIIRDREHPSKDFIKRSQDKE